MKEMIELPKIVYEAVKVLSDRDKLTAYDMFFNYVFNGIEPDFNDERFNESKEMWEALFIFWKDYVIALSKKE